MQVETGIHCSGRGIRLTVMVGQHQWDAATVFRKKCMGDKNLEHAEEGPAKAEAMANNTRNDLVLAMMYRALRNDRRYIVLQARESDLRDNLRRNRANNTKKVGNARRLLREVSDLAQTLDKLRDIEVRT